MSYTGINSKNSTNKINIVEEINNTNTVTEGLPKTIGQFLIEKNISIASAESCTGGMFAQFITDVPGISAVFDRGIVTYSNQAKMDELGVKRETLDKYGAVSRQTAIEMAQGIKRVAGTRVGVSVTGIAGPGGATKDKPVGLVYVCVAFDDRMECRELRLNGDRANNRKESMINMFDLIGKLVCSSY